MERGVEKVYELGKMRLDELLTLAREVGAHFVGGETVLLYGELGTGKTTFVRGLAKGIGVDGRLVRSPTFNIVNTYPGKLNLIHADLYRLENREELFSLALEDLRDESTVLAVEWPELYANLASPPCLVVALNHSDETVREVSLRPLDEVMESKLSFLNGENRKNKSM